MLSALRQRVSGPQVAELEVQATAAKAKVELIHAQISELKVRLCFPVQEIRAQASDYGSETGTSPGAYIWVICARLEVQALLPRKGEANSHAHLRVEAVHVAVGVAVAAGTHQRPSTTALHPCADTMEVISALLCRRSGSRSWSASSAPSTTASPSTSARSAAPARSPSASTVRLCCCRLHAKLAAMW